MSNQDYALGSSLNGLNGKTRVIIQEVANGFTVTMGAETFVALDYKAVADILFGKDYGLKQPETPKVHGLSSSAPFPDHCSTDGLGTTKARVQPSSDSVGLRGVTINSQQLAKGCAGSSPVTGLGQVKDLGMGFHKPNCKCDATSTYC